MIYFKHRCVGFTLRKTKRRLMQLWICFGGHPAHRHPGQSFEVIPIWGRADFFRRKPGPEGVQSARVNEGEHLRAFTIPDGWLHWFNTRFLVVLTITDKPVPATENYVET